MSDTTLGGRAYRSGQGRGTVSAISQSRLATVTRARVQGTIGCAGMAAGRRGGTLAGVNSPWKSSSLAVHESHARRECLVENAESLQKVLEHYGEIMDRAG